MSTFAERWKGCWKGIFGGNNPQEKRIATTVYTEGGVTRYERLENGRRVKIQIIPAPNEYEPEIVVQDPESPYQVILTRIFPPLSPK